MGPVPRSEQVSDQEFLKRVRDGYTPAFATLVQRHQAALLRLVGPFVATREDAEDAVQEAFVEAYRQIDRFRGEASFRTWVGRIAIYRAMATAKKRSPKTRENTALDGAHRDTDAAETIAVREAVWALPEEMRVAVVLRFWREMSGREIAELLGVEQSTVWTRIYRGLDQVRQTLEGEEHA